MYILVYHKNLLPDKWYSYPRHKQLLMIANEMNRSLNALYGHDVENAIHAWERAFELTDLTVSDPKNPPIHRELLRFREMLGELFVYPDAGLNKLLMETLIQMNPTAYNMLH
jgi:hypothetical protein